MKLLEMFLYQRNLFCQLSAAKNEFHRKIWRCSRLMSWVLVPSSRVFRQILADQELRGSGDCQDATMDESLSPTLVPLLLVQIGSENTSVWVDLSKTTLKSLHDISYTVIGQCDMKSKKKILSESQHQQQPYKAESIKRLSSKVFGRSCVSSHFSLLSTVSYFSPPLLPEYRQNPIRNSLMII